MNDDDRLLARHYLAALGVAVFLLLSLMLILPGRMG